MTSTETSLAAEIRHAVLVRAKPERVYNALTDPRQVDAWFTCGSFGEARPGSRITWRWREWGPDRITAEDTLLVQEAKHPERFVFLWHPAGSEHPTTVEVHFEAVEDGTVVRLREYGYPATERGLRACLDCATGWGEALTLLKFYVEYGLSY